MDHVAISKEKIEIQGMFLDAVNAGEVQHFHKIGKVISRPAIPGETIITTCGGKVETLHTAVADDIIVKNVMPGSSAETYILKKGKFTKRYELSGSVFNVDGQRFELAIAKGEVDAFIYQGDEITFIAPWNEPMFCQPGDYICSEDKFYPGADDIYRIAAAEFKGSYEFVANVKPIEASGSEVVA